MELDPPEYIDPRDLPRVFDGLARRNRARKQRHYAKAAEARRSRARHQKGNR